MKKLLPWAPWWTFIQSLVLLWVFRNNMDRVPFGPLTWMLLVITVWEQYLTLKRRWPLTSRRKEGG